jgi:ABC-type glycerol-3-phosphate transport system permease component
MVLTSVKELPQIVTSPPVFIPKPIALHNYVDALTFLPFGRFFRNTFVIAFFVIVGDLLSCSFIAYGFARLRFPGRDFLFIVLISTMMVPFAVRLLPLFLIFKSLGWINTYLPLIVPAYFGTPFFIFLVRQFYRSIPQDLVDAARIDGASEIGIWWRIMLPLSKPVLIVVAIFAFQQTWNDFLAPLIYLNDKDKWTVALGLNGLVGTSGQSVEQWNWLMAASTAAIIPMLLIFAVAQRYFVEGVTLTGMKG